ncbi:xanthine dehydrogenase family protein molybdopterin-binding subunit [Lichenicoccus roseus]|uniref:Xanthine dehydrogenase family protein molybdopterin-binding subunit n=1 Tax=Lichenicoccus roseus TaxID=2683649 RepID=A0A5R9J7A4_9PROT|nr:xanthine dehydrogenase family protein molybdopterin-binding subunit [Lichenicoccus roseus]TLU73452.1 xanthine dehydrogenase family protein molybdopterin-binding subunit [Lichenicoccus roseus]
MQSQTPIRPSLFDSPAGPNPLDQEHLLGRGIARVDGPLKVSGRAPYAYEVHDPSNTALVGVLVLSTVAQGSIRTLDAVAAEHAPGVRLVLTHRNMQRQGGPASEHCKPQMADATVRQNGQVVALVVADSFEQANAAAAMVAVAYDVKPALTDLAAGVPQATVPPPRSPSQPVDTNVGDFAQGFAAAAVKIDATYTTPHQAHAMMEPHASMAVWDGDHLTLHTSHQMLSTCAQTLASTLLLRPDQVRVLSPYIGGGFGSKLVTYADAILSATAARQLGRPVKIALTRPQVFGQTTHRTATIQRVRLGADADGTLRAIGHESWSGNQQGQTFYETAANQTRLLYAAHDRMTAHRQVRLDLPLASSMRAPGEAVGLLALECAMDELAERLRMDPVALRVRNDTQYDPEKGPSRPFSSRRLTECLHEGAARFGWEKRSPVPGQRREGQWLVGMGMASAIRNVALKPSNAEATLDGRGILTVGTAMTDIGTGTYTILTQIAGEMLGLPPERVVMQLGDTDLPEASGSGGSFGAASSGSAVYYACAQLRIALARRAGFDPARSRFENGQIIQDGRAVSLASLAGAQGIAATGGIKPGDLLKKYAQASFGAHFAEVGVDADTGEVRVRRMLGVFGIGRVLNASTARSQAIGGMIFGIGAALMEDVVPDRRHGDFVNHDLAEYHVPVHADVPAVEAYFVEEVDPIANPLKAKGVGELGICGAGAAVANAIYNASGVRIRDYPMTLDKVLAGLPDQA